MRGGASKSTESAASLGAPSAPVALGAQSCTMAPRWPRAHDTTKRPFALHASATISDGCAPTSVRRVLRARARVEL